MIWDTTFGASDALDLPTGKLGEVVGGIVLERDFSSQDVLGAAAYLIEQCWPCEASTQAEVMVSAQTLGHGSRTPKLQAMRYRPNRIQSALDQAKAAGRKLATARTEAERQLAQSEVEAAESEFQAAKAELDAEIERLQTQLPQAN
jgi:hypothetical protein